MLWFMVFSFLSAVVFVFAKHFTCQSNRKLHLASRLLTFDKRVSHKEESFSQTNIYVPFITMAFLIIAELNHELES